MITNIHMEFLQSLRNRIEGIYSDEELSWGVTARLHPGSVHLDSGRLKALDFYFRCPQDGDLPPVYYSLENALDLYSALQGLHDECPHLIEMTKTLVHDLALIAGVLRPYI